MPSSHPSLGVSNFFLSFFYRPTEGGKGAADASRGHLSGRERDVFPGGHASVPGSGPEPTPRDPGPADAVAGGRTDGEAELRQTPPTGDDLSEAVLNLLRTKPGVIAVGNAGGGECGPLSLGYNGARDRPSRSQTGERRADLVCFARANPELIVGVPATTIISLSQAVARSFREYAHQYGAEPTFEAWCSVMARPGVKYDDLGAGGQPSGRRLPDGQRGG